MLQCYKETRPLYIAGGIKNGTITLENTLEVSLKVKYTLLAWPSNFIAGYIPKKIENICSHKDLDIYVHRIIMQKNENLRKFKCP